MKLLNNVLIKIVRGGHTDLVLYLDNVPEDMFYRMAYPVMAVGVGQQQHWEADTTKPMQPTLHEELSLSQTGDGGIVFDMDKEHAIARYARLKRYIHQQFPANVLPPEPVPNSVEPSNPAASALPKDMIPRAVLPVLSPPSGAQENPSKVALAAGTVGAALNLDVEAIKAQAVAEYKEQESAKVKERLALARAAKASKD